MGELDYGVSAPPNFSGRAFLLTRPSEPSTFAALALATDPATRESLARKPDHKSANLVNLDMWKMIIGQSIYQLVVILVLNFSGKQILGLDAPTDEATRIQFDDEHKTLVFNAFVFCQIFNQFNARVLDRSFNIFRGILKNYYFVAIFLIMLGGQVGVFFPC